MWGRVAACYCGLVNRPDGDLMSMLGGYHTGLFTLLVHIAPTNEGLFTLLVHIAPTNEESWLEIHLYTIMRCHHELSEPDSNKTEQHLI